MRRNKNRRTIATGYGRATISPGIRVLEYRYGMGSPRPCRERGRVRVLSKAVRTSSLQTPHLDPLPFAKGRGEKGCLLVSLSKTGNQRTASCCGIRSVGRRSLIDARGRARTPLRAADRRARDCPPSPRSDRRLITAASAAVGASGAAAVQLNEPPQIASSSRRPHAR